MANKNKLQVAYNNKEGIRVRFIRKNGKIIPIKITQAPKQRDVYRGAALIAAGAAVAAGGGYVAAKLLARNKFAMIAADRAHDFLFRSKNAAQIPLDPKFTKNFEAKLARKVTKFKAAAETYKKSSTYVKRGAFAASASLGYAGFQKILPKTNKEAKDLRIQALSGTAGVGAAYGVQKAFNATFWSDAYPFIKNPPKTKFMDVLKKFSNYAKLRF